MIHAAALVAVPGRRCWLNRPESASACHWRYVEPSQKFLPAMFPSGLGNRAAAIHLRRQRSLIRLSRVTSNDQMRSEEMSLGSIDHSTVRKVRLCEDHRRSERELSGGVISRWSRGRWRRPRLPCLPCSSMLFLLWTGRSRFFERLSRWHLQLALDFHCPSILRKPDRRAERAKNRARWIHSVAAPQPTALGLSSEPST
jgi:hypothetical protein